MTVDWLIGRRVKAVKTKSGGGWTLTFDDGARIVYDDSDSKAPKHLKDIFLQSVTFIGETTTLRFGTKDLPNAQVIELQPLLYGMALAGQKALVYPQRDPDEQIPLPDDPSPERVADGPTGP